MYVLQIFFSSGTSALIGPEDKFDVQTLAWIIEIPQHRPRLHSMRIEDESIPLPCVNRGVRLRSIPPEIENAFQAAGIEIKLYLWPSQLP
jgi:hypothetical protein